LRAADHERLYQVARQGIAWLPAAEGPYQLPVTVADDRVICRGQQSPRLVGVVAGGECVGRTPDGLAARSTRFDRLFQAR
jgi:hypothetical protein